MLTALSLGHPHLLFKFISLSKSLTVARLGASVFSEVLTSEKPSGAERH